MLDVNVHVGVTSPVRGVISPMAAAAAAEDGSMTDPHFVPRVLVSCSGE